MKRKLICFSLALLTLVSLVLSSCSQKGTSSGESETDSSAKTITMWLMTKDETTDQAKKLVNEAFTEITKSVYKTNVILKFCTEDEYYEKLEKTIADAQADVMLLEECRKELRLYLKTHKDDADVATLTKKFYQDNPKYSKFYNSGYDEEEATGEVEEETMINDLGITEIKYPDENENQVDIFYISGYDKYNEYYQNDWLAILDDELTTSSRKLTDYISTSLLNGVQMDGSVYAIPNNVPIGEYTYMMIDKEYRDQWYSTKIENIDSVLDIKMLLNDIKNMNGTLSPDDPEYVVPLQSTFEECMKMLVWYWEMSYVDRSVYETYYDETNGRTYALYLEGETTYEVIDEETGEGVEQKKQTFVPYVVEGQLYKVNSLGQYVDKDGKVLNYTYVADTENAWYMDMEGEYSNKKQTNVAGRYLVDEDGNPVTKENDKRVIVTDGVETKYDTDGNVRPTYEYSYNKASDFSVLGTMYGDPSDRSRGEINLGFNALFADSKYRDLYLTLKEYEFEGYFGEAREGQNAAVFFKKGNAGIKLEYDNNGVYVDPDNGREYYVVVAEYPEATDKELYGNMFAVYANSSNISRSMEVITRINTNKELRNLLQYGILGQHYELNDDGTVTLLTSGEEAYGTYRMDIEKTGNCFIAYPTSDLGADVWEIAKQQNNDSLVQPLLGFDFNSANESSDYSIDITLIDYINDINGVASEKIAACTTIEEVEELFDNEDDGGFASLYSRKDAIIAKAINPTYNPNMPKGESAGENQDPDVNGDSPNTVYYNWLSTYGYAA